MANKSLTDLTARTATADSDLIHVNSGGTDYKEEKINFIKGSFGIEFSSDSLLTSQIDALPSAKAFHYEGIIIGNGHQTETGLPEAQVFAVYADVYASAYKIIEIVKIGDANVRYVCTKSSTWSAWSQLPARSEITSLNNSLTQCLTKTAGYIESGNLNNYVNSGMYLMADKNNIANCPSSWSALLVIGATGGYGCHQLTFASGYGIYYRSLTGSPLAWTAWKHLSGS